MKLGDQMAPKLTIVWKCVNPFCPKRKEWTEPLSVEYSTEERNIALCPRCNEYTLVKMKEVWDVTPDDKWDVSDDE